mmetsp:Transcript_6806/g.11972  ORF Transcript_6806/g.11972 Transcript_6806/m.11972 type:complete len:428 (-) Transcript_6806:46-1329(-)
MDYGWNFEASPQLAFDINTFAVPDDVQAWTQYTQSIVKVVTAKSTSTGILLKMASQEQGESAKRRRSARLFLTCYHLNGWQEGVRVVSYNEAHKVTRLQFKDLGDSHNCTVVAQDKVNDVILCRVENSQLFSDSSGVEWKPLDNISSVEKGTKAVLVGLIHSQYAGFEFWKRPPEDLLTSPALLQYLVSIKVTGKAETSESDAQRTRLRVSEGKVVQTGETPDGVPFVEGTFHACPGSSGSIVLIGDEEPFMTFFLKCGGEDANCNRAFGIKIATWNALIEQSLNDTLSADGQPGPAAPKEPPAKKAFCIRRAALAWSSEIGEALPNLSGAFHQLEIKNTSEVKCTDAWKDVFPDQYRRFRNQAQRFTAPEWSAASSQECPTETIDNIQPGPMDQSSTGNQNGADSESEDAECDAEGVACFFHVDCV